MSAAGDGDRSDRGSGHGLAVVTQDDGFGLIAAAEPRLDVIRV